MSSPRTTAQQRPKASGIYVGRLRRKLEDDPQRPTMIKTVRGSGYILTPTVEVI
jgi:DNA-binding response OmpR family regulator